MKETTIQFNTMYGQKEPAKGFVVGRIWAVHHTPKGTGTFYNDKWTVTHMPSGYSVLSSLSTRRAAVDAAKKIAGYARRIGVKTTARTADGFKRANSKKTFERFRSYVYKFYGSV